MDESRVACECSVSEKNPLFKRVSLLHFPFPFSPLPLPPSPFSFPFPFSPFTQERLAGKLVLRSLMLNKTRMTKVM